MSKPKYTIKSISDDKLRFEFESISPEKTVVKVVEFEQIDENGIYFNLALVDMDENGNYSDNTITDNKDTEKVFGTIAKTIDFFFQENPDRRVLIFSNDPLRIRLYRMIISNYSHEKEQNWRFYGLLDNTFLEFEKGKNYTAFMIALKKIKL
jgi:uncharacterized protein (TIGR02588 family)